MKSLFINYLLKYPNEGIDRSITKRIRINTTKKQTHINRLRIHLSFVAIMCLYIVADSILSVILGFSFSTVDLIPTKLSSEPSNAITISQKV